MRAFATSASFAAHVDRYLRLGGELFVGSLYGRVVATGGSLAYGDVACIGLMAVDVELRGHGFGAAMLRFIEASARARGVRGFVLDATDSGRALYAGHGYDVVEPCEELVFGGALGAADDVPAVGAETLEGLVRFDAEMLGMDRPSTVRVYATDPGHRTLVARDEVGAIAGYLVAQPAVLGPFVVRDPAVAEALLRKALSLRFAAAPRALVPGGNERAQSLLRAHGFASGRTLTHMRKGARARADSGVLYGKASFAAG